MNKYRKLLLLLIPTTVLILCATIATNGEVSAQQNQTACVLSYTDVCIAPPPPDLNCADVPYHNIRINGSDPHGLDGNDNDGIGCET